SSNFRMSAGNLASASIFWHRGILLRLADKGDNPPPAASLKLSEEESPHDSKSRRNPIPRCAGARGRGRGSDWTEAWRSSVRSEPRVDCRETRLTAQTVMETVSSLGNGHTGLVWFGQSERKTHGYVPRHV